MKNSSVDKKGVKPLNKEGLARYKTLVKVSESSVEHFKDQADQHQENINQYRIVIEHYEFVIDNIELSGKELLDQDPKIKEAIGELRNRVEFAQAIIRKHKDMTAGSKDIIKLCKRLTLVSERRLKKYKDLLLAKRTGKARIVDPRD